MYGIRGYGLDSIDFNCSDVYKVNGASEYLKCAQFLDLLSEYFPCKKSSVPWNKA